MKKRKLTAAMLSVAMLAGSITQLPAATTASAADIAIEDFSLADLTMTEIGRAHV